MRGKTILSAVDSPATDDALAALPSLPRDSGEPIFAEPWQAQAFALAVRLSADGHFTWKEWASALADELAAAAHRGEPDDGSLYYLHWVAALERLVIERGLAANRALETRKEAWAEAYRNTPHGRPVELRQTDYLQTFRASVMRTDGREVQIVQRRAHLSVLLRKLLLWRRRTWLCTRSGRDVQAGMDTAAPQEDRTPHQGRLSRPVHTGECGEPGVRRPVCVVSLGERTGRCPADLRLHRCDDRRRRLPPAARIARAARLQLLRLGATHASAQ